MALRIPYLRPAARHDTVTATDLIVVRRTLTEEVPMKEKRRARGQVNLGAVRTTRYGRATGCSEAQRLLARLQPRTSKGRGGAGLMPVRRLAPSTRSRARAP